jgi:hypothetical protein
MPHSGQFEICSDLKNLKRLIMQLMIANVEAGKKSGGSRIFDVG